MSKRIDLNRVRLPEPFHWCLIELLLYEFHIAWINWLGLYVCNYNGSRIFFVEDGSHKISYHGQKDPSYFLSLLYIIICDSFVSKWITKWLIRHICKIASSVEDQLTIRFLIALGNACCIVLEPRKWTKIMSLNISVNNCLIFQAPPRADVVKSLKNGIGVNLVGMGAAILGMQATVGLLVAKALTTSANPYYQGITPGYSPVLALDVFLVQVLITDFRFALLNWNLENVKYRIYLFYKFLVFVQKQYDGLG